MAVDCPHWSDCGICSGGCCAVGKYGGRPSIGTCELVCLGLPPKPPSVLAQVAHGAAGVAQAVLHIDRADDATIKRRRAICLSCDERDSIVGGIVTKCSKCGCLLAAKVVNAQEHCPLAKW